MQSDFFIRLARSPGEIAVRQPSEKAAKIRALESANSERREPVCGRRRCASRAGELRRDFRLHASSSHALESSSRFGRPAFGDRADD